MTDKSDNSSSKNVKIEPIISNTNPTPTTLARPSLPDKDNRYDSKNIRNKE